ncbi:MAG: hypothetical protein QM731_10150 [Chitinophagaceae bacterium]
MKKLTLVCLVAVFGLVNYSQAQSEYKSAIGLRVGLPVAASLKHFITDAGAIEGHAGFWHEAPGWGGYNYFSFGAMYQHHFPIGDIPGFKWYVGGGILGQVYSYSSRWKDYYGSDHYSNFGLGFHPVGGVDYKFAKIPLAVSADVMPTFFVGDLYYNFRTLGGVAARYTFR